MVKKKEFRKIVLAFYIRTKSERTSKIKIKLTWEALRPVCVSNTCEKSVNKGKNQTQSKKNWQKFMKVRNKSYFSNENTKSLLTLT